MPDAPNYAEVQRALVDELPSIMRQIPVEGAQLSLPTDGRGARIRASVRPIDQHRMPSQVSVEMDGRRLSIPVETTTDHLEYEAY